jgi:hypothetical protein
LLQKIYILETKKPSDTVWATRWDTYLNVSDPSIHWFSLINSIIIILFLTGMLSLILARALHKDISRYNAIDAQVRTLFWVEITSLMDKI